MFNTEGHTARELVDRKGMDQRSPILIRLFKEESELEVWKQQKATASPISRSE